ncbi:MAG: thioredoxin [Saprospirales bacterium]|jgi:thioredoxin-related protein|nr:thioredoxin [Saprospirales bacterium]
MKKITFLVLSLAAVVVVAIAAKNIKSNSNPAPSNGDSAIQWLSWDEAVKANETVKKKFFIDFYTDWCGWCKRMDKTTFTDPAVVKYINENFHPIKFNAEQKEDIVFQGRTFKWRAGGRNGVHTLAYELLNGRLGYPSYVYLTPDFERILISPGYKPAPDLIKELEFVAGDHYETTSWDDYKKSK